MSLLEQIKKERMPVNPDEEMTLVIYSERHKPEGDPENPDDGLPDEQDEDE